MNFSFIFKSLFLSLFVILIIFAIGFSSTQKYLLESNNYGIKDSIKESINIAYYRQNGDIIFDNDTLIKKVLENYVKNNNIKMDEVSFEISVDEVQNIVTVKIDNKKNILDSDSRANYTFSYQVIER